MALTRIHLHLVGRFALACVQRRRMFMGSLPKPLRVVGMIVTGVLGLASSVAALLVFLAMISSFASLKFATGGVLQTYLGFFGPILILGVLLGLAALCAYGYARFMGMSASEIRQLLRKPDG